MVPFAPGEVTGEGATRNRGVGFASSLFAPAALVRSAARANPLPLTVRTSTQSPRRERIATLRNKYAGTAVTATEPVFDYMADALGLKMRNGRFQLAVMNGTEPSAAAIAAFERDLRTRAVKVLLYNSQTSQALAERMRTIAEQAGVPVVAVTETEPQGLTYQEWMLAQLDTLDRALGGR